MIQRIQTVFLFLAIVSIGLLLWLPLMSVEWFKFSENFQGYNIMSLYDGYLYFINVILAGTAIALTLINIFMYKNRKLQVFLCWAAILFIAASEAYVLYRYETKIYIGTVYLRKWNLIAVAAVAFELLAMYYIRKDEKLVKSMDRLR